MRKILIVLNIAVLAFLFSGCGALISEDDLVTSVKKQGYSEVVVHSKHIFFVRWHGCSNGDDAAFKISANNASGERVNLIACAGWPFKKVTVRS